MNKIVEIRDLNELFQYYNDLLQTLIMPETKVLYVGYENNDVLLQIIEKYASLVIAIDCEERTNLQKNNVQYVTQNFLDIDIEKYNNFDYVVLSFILHENASEMHQQMLEIAKKISRNIIIIEPLRRTDKEGVVFEEYVKKYFLKHNKTKQYYGMEYWKTISNFDDYYDQCHILKRNNENIKNRIYKNSNKPVTVSVQDIAILLVGIKKKEI